MYLLNMYVLLSMLNERLLKRDSSMCMNHTLRAVVKVMTSDTITTIISSGRSVYVNTCSINTSSSNSDKKVKENSFIKNEDTRFCHLRGNMTFLSLIIVKMDTSFGTLT